jgi:hypothetical protein
MKQLGAVTLMSLLLFGICLPIVFIPAPAQAAADYVQECVTSQGPSSTTVACTFGTSVTAGNLIACASFYPSNTVTITVADTASNTYTINPAQSYLDDTGNVFRGVPFFAQGVTGGFTTLTVTFSSTMTNRQVVCHEASGIATSSANDGAVGQYQLNSSSATDGISSTAIVPTQDGDYLFGATFDTSNQCINTTAGTGWTGHTLTGCNSFSEHQIQGTAASVAATFTDGNGSSDHITFIQAFKAAASSSILMQGGLVGGIGGMH